MAEKAAQDQAAKARIISHMNNDHHDSVVRYLQHYGKLSSFSAYDGRLSDIDLSSMTLSCRGKTVRVPFEPPMSSYREARERVVELDKTCRRALGHSDVTVKEYRAPLGKYGPPFLVVLATFIGYSQRWWFAKGGPVAQVLGSQFAAFSWHIQPWLLSGLFLVHGAEIIIWARYRLAVHSVNVRTPIWWLWSISFFIEGFFAVWRFDEMVKAQREKQKH